MRAIGKVRMKNGSGTAELIEMRNNIRRAVHSLEVCWKCQNVSECLKYVLGHTVLVWLCKGCLSEMEKPVAERPKHGRERWLRSFPQPGEAIRVPMQAISKQRRSTRDIPTTVECRVPASLE